MDTRFRVRFREGGDTTVGSLEAFYDLVQSGGLTADDLVFDALTGQWVPAKAHPAYWLCTDPLVDPSGEGSQEAAGGQSAESEFELAEATPGPAPADAEAGQPAEPEFELAEATPGPTPAEAASAFVQRMDEERAADSDVPLVLAELSGLEDGMAVLQQQGEPRVEREWVDEAHVPSWADDVQEEDQRGHRAEPAYATPARAPRHLHVSLTVVLVLGSAGVAGGVGLAWPDLHLFAPVDTQAAAVTPRPVTATEEDLRGAAFTEFLGEVARLGESFGIGPVPEVWLAGRYLADAAAYPEVSEYWVRYRDYVEVARNQDDDLYRAAYLAGMESLGVTGPVRSLRLATAVADFSAERAAREAVYVRVAGLADAALELHELSAAAQGRISYEPARANRVSADPVIEATGRDAEMQGALNLALDRVLSALHGEVGLPGPGREGVAGWLVEALKARAG